MKSPKTLNASRDFIVKCSFCREKNILLQSIKESEKIKSRNIKCAFCNKRLGVLN